MHAGRVPDPPFLITSQPSLLDPTRAPAGRHTFWVYAHVPSGYDGDLTDAVERQVERFAPGFRDLVLARHVSRPADLEADNPPAEALALLMAGDVADADYRTLVPADSLATDVSFDGSGLDGVYQLTLADPQWAERPDGRAAYVTTAELEDQRTVTFASK